MRRLILATGIMFVLAAPAFATTNRDGNWQGDVQCEESPHYTFRLAVTDGRFAHTDHNLSIQGTISHDSYKVRGRLKSGGKFSIFGYPGVAVEDSIQGSSYDSPGVLCFVKLIRQTSPEEQQALVVESRKAVQQEAEKKAAAVDPSAAAEIARLQRKLEELQIANQAREIDRDYRVRVGH